MATQITLKIKDEEGNIQKRQHEIEDINLLQFKQMMKVLKDIFVQLQEDESLKQLFMDLFNQEVDKAGEGELDTNEQQFINNLINSFETLAVHMPEKAIQLLSILSEIDENTLKEQKIFDVFDVFDAVIEENDIERLWKRAKKSFAKSKVKMSFLNFARQETERA